MGPSRRGVGSLLPPFLSLAAVGVVVLSASVALTNYIVDGHRDGVADISRWTTQSDALGRLGGIAAAVNAPGNDVFATRDPARERARLDSAIAAFEAELGALKRDFRAPSGEVSDPSGENHLVVLQAAFEEMGREGKAVLTAFEARREDVAGAHMAAMDRAYARATSLMRGLQATGRAHVRAQVAARQAHLDRLRTLQTLLGAAILLVIVGTVVYGRRLAATALRQSQSWKEQVETLATRERELVEIRAELERRVTERTAELRDQHEFLRQVVDTIPHFVFAKDRSGTFTLANASVAAAYGVTVDGLLGRTDADFNSDPEQLANFRTDDLRVLDGLEQLFVPEEPITDASGALRWLQTVKRPIIGPDGRATHVLGVCTDITALRAASERSQQLAAIVQASSDAIFSVDLSGIVVSWNPAAERLYGYSAAEVIGTSIEALVPPEAEASLASVRTSLERGDAASGVETVGRRKDGSLFDAALSVVPIRRLDGSITGRAAFVRDITAQKRALADLRERETQLAEAQQVARLGSWYWDIPTNEVYWSDELFRLFGHEPGAVAAGYEAFIRAVHPEDVATVQSRIDHAMRTGQSVEYVFRHRRAENDIRYHSARLRVHADADGRPVRLTGTSLDITDLKRIERAERDARLAAEAASQAKSEFLANMSHEIRTPMNGVMGMLELVLATRLSDQQRDFLQTAWSSAEALLKLINDILDFSKIEAGHLELDPAPFDLRTTVARTLAPLVMRASEKGIVLAHEVAPGLPPVLVGDAGRLRQVLVNLVGNAIKFTAEGTVTVRVAGATAGDDVELHVEIHDTGVGIPPEKMGIIFDAFQQADASTSREFGGTGLGLAIAARLVELLGGTISVESVAGEGSVFRFTCRMQRAPADATIHHPGGAVPGLAHPLRPAGPVGRPLRVLVAEDNPVNQKLVKALLGRQGYDVTTVPDGQQAIEAARAGGFDIIVMDVQMPYVNGLDATRAIREHERATGAPRTPIIALTAGAMKGDREACIDAGMDAYVAKPLRSDELFAEIDRLSSQRSPGAVSAGARGGSAPRQAGGAPAGDEARLLQVVHDDRMLLGELVEIFLDAYPHQLQRIRRAIGDADWAAVQETAHSMKGSTGSLTAVRAADAAGDLERLARAGDAAAMGPALQRLEAELATLHEWLVDTMNHVTG